MIDSLFALKGSRLAHLLLGVCGVVVDYLIVFCTLICCKDNTFLYNFQVEAIKMKKRLEKQLADLQDKLPCAKAMGRGRPVGAVACSAPERNVMMLGILVKKWCGDFG